MSHTAGGGGGGGGGGGPGHSLSGPARGIIQRQLAAAAADNQFQSQLTRPRVSVNDEHIGDAPYPPHPPTTRGPSTVKCPARRRTNGRTCAANSAGVQRDVCGLRGGVVVSAFVDLRFIRLRSFRFQTATLGKLFAHMSLCLPSSIRRYRRRRPAAGRATAGLAESTGSRPAKCALLYMTYSRAIYLETGDQHRPPRFLLHTDHGTTFALFYLSEGTCPEFCPIRGHQQSLLLKGE